MKRYSLLLENRPDLFANRLTYMTLLSQYDFFVNEFFGNILEASESQGYNLLKLQLLFFDLLIGYQKLKVCHQTGNSRMKAAVSSGSAVASDVPSPLKRETLSQPEKIE